MFKTVLTASIVTLALGGCATLPFGIKSGATDTPAASAETGTRPQARPEGGAPAPSTTARTVEQFDTTTSAERTAAAAAPTGASTQQLGRTIASLGDPTDPGFWIETGLVTTVQPGRLDYPANGTSVQVELRPSGGPPDSGSRVSLPALRVLNAPLTELPELVMFAVTGQG
jgi:hypothetical protein